jgi:quinolinate synthase
LWSATSIAAHNAEKVIATIPEEVPIIFTPDQHLGRFLQKKTGRAMKIWQGSCIVHEIFSEQGIMELKNATPNALLLAHPECEEAVLRHADHIGSTTSIINRAIEGPETAFIVATEEGVIHQMRKAAPDKSFIPAPTNTGCACNRCPHMRKNTLDKIYLSLRDLSPTIEMDEALRERARVPLQRMMDLSRGIAPHFEGFRHSA